MSETSAFPFGAQDAMIRVASYGMVVGTFRYALSCNSEMYTANGSWLPLDKISTSAIAWLYSAMTGVCSSIVITRRDEERIIPYAAIAFVSRMAAACRAASSAARRSRHLVITTVKNGTSTVVTIAVLTAATRGQSQPSVLAVAAAGSAVASTALNELPKISPSVGAPASAVLNTSNPTEGDHNNQDGATS